MGELRGIVVLAAALAVLLLGSMAVRPISAVAGIAASWNDASAAVENPVDPHASGGERGTDDGSTP